MNDWVVVVMRKRDHQRKRVFVEGIESESEAEKIALSKLGIDSLEHDAYADLIDDRVSLENPINNLKERYEKIVADLEAVKIKYQEAVGLSATNLKRAEKAETELAYKIRVSAPLDTKVNHMKIELVEVRRDRDRMIKVNQFMQAKLLNVRLELDQIEKLCASIGLEIE